jgi:uncharacterized protein (UPF0548 family)
MSASPFPSDLTLSTLQPFCRLLVRSEQERVRKSLLYYGQLQGHVERAAFWKG